MTPLFGSTQIVPVPAGTPIVDPSRGYLGTVSKGKAVRHNFTIYTVPEDYESLKERIIQCSKHPPST